MPLNSSHQQMRPRRPLRALPSEAEIVVGHGVLPATSSQETRRSGSIIDELTIRIRRHVSSMLVHKGSHLGTLDADMSAPDVIEEVMPDDDDAPEGVTIERAAEIEAFLTVLTDEPRDELLERFELDEERWSSARKVWTERIEDEVMRAAAPGQRISAEEKYRLSMRYSIAYAKAAERAREGVDAHGPAGLPSAPDADRVMRLGSGHG